MGKEVWPVERRLQGSAEDQGHPPCTYCVPAHGSAERSDHTREGDREPNGACPIGVGHA